MSSQNSKILLNDNIHSHKSQRGVARYFRKIMAGVISRFGTATTVCSSQAYDYDQARHVRTLPLDFRGSYRLGFHRVNELIVDLTLRHERPALIYSPYYSKIRSQVPLILTVYDTIPELFPSYFPTSKAYYRDLLLTKEICINQAAILLAISHHTAKDLTRCYPHINPDKIIAIPLGVDEAFFITSPTVKSITHTSKPYFIYVGQRTQYKNFLRLLIAYGQSGLAGIIDLLVISPVGTNFDAEEAKQIAKYKLQDSVRLVSAASEEALRQSYAGAIALIYPSEYEGFGLPVLEALASGTLVAASNASSIPEVGGEVAFYFDPHNIDTIVTCLGEVAYLAADERTTRIAQGIAHARQFTWERCQQQTINAFLRLVN